MDSPEATRSPSRVISVLLPLPLAGAYDYTLPEAMEAAPGDFVRVPLGRRQVMGVVWGPGSGQVASARLKPLHARLDLPPMPQSLRRFIDWVAEYTLSPPGAVLRLAMRGPGDALSEPAAHRYALAGAPPARRNAARENVLRLAADGQARSVADFVRLSGAGAGVVRGLIAAGTLQAVKADGPAAAQKPNPDHPGPRLSPAQSAAAQVLRDAVKANAYSCTLLEGVTGAGKTEVYFEAVAEALRQGRQVLILLPEIALTVQFMARFAARFGCRPVEWHSELTPARRRDAWRGVATGAGRVVVGARSALFLPFTEPGLIVVDEEHDAAFKQEDGVTYQARDMAVARAHLLSIPILLSSATPSLESVVNARNGRYRAVKLPDRYGGAVLPQIEAVDMRAAQLPADRFLSPHLLEGMAGALGRDEQVLLFLNRRGYAPVLLCHACGWVPKCQRCDAHYTLHRTRQVLLCHHCGGERPLPPSCAECASGDLLPLGAGTERIEADITALFPEHTVLRVDRDSTRRRGALDAHLSAVRDGRADILVGTQMLAKGHHFPAVTLVGILDADQGLFAADFRASERLAQTIYQVAGRCGRGTQPGRVLIQTHQPQHPVLHALLQGGYGVFAQQLLKEREAAGWPPFTHLALLRAEAPGAQEALWFLGETLSLAAELGHAGVTLLGPVPAPMPKRAGRFRAQLLLQADRRAPLHALLRSWLPAVAQLPAARKVRWSLDVDPIDTY
ncbi:MAG TPA: primosomal protein N' [Gammaproteobacteria bacterium]|nr:primosomal protein N' [Gammaproteobacteria bacterium]MCH78219.1 primosomal protein N' [Gammaproteobacteria bacterium]